MRMPAASFLLFSLLLLLLHSSNVAFTTARVVASFSSGRRSTTAIQPGGRRTSRCFVQDAAATSTATANDIVRLEMACGGYCVRCGTIHELPRTPGAVDAVRVLRRKVLRGTEGSLRLGERWWLDDDEAGDAGVDGAEGPPSSLRTTRGKMLGALECVDRNTGETVFLAAFAGKLEGAWSRPGWVPPLAVPEDVPAFVAAAADVARMTRERAALLDDERVRVDGGGDGTSSSDERERAMLRQEKRRSRRATEGIRALQEAQVVHNFRGESTPVPLAYHALPSASKRNKKKRRNRKKRGRSQRAGHRHHRDRDDDEDDWKTTPAPPFLKTAAANFPPLGDPPNIPSARSPSTTLPKAPPLLPGGVGDCAAPRLLNAAARNREDLRPVGVAEIFAGATGGMSLRRKDGALYDACEERCRPILGWMLCGLFRDGDLVRGNNDHNNHTDDNDDDRDV